MPWRRSLAVVAVWCVLCGAVSAQGTIGIIGTQKLPITRVDGSACQVSDLPTVDAAGRWWCAAAAASGQPADASLTAFAALVTAADKCLYFTGSDVPALADCPSFGRSLMNAANAAAGLTALGAAPTASPTFTGMVGVGIAPVVGLHVSGDPTANYIRTTDNRGATSSYAQVEHNSGVARYTGLNSTVELSAISSNFDVVIRTLNTERVRISGQSGTLGMMQFGGTTSSFPALKRSTTTIEARLANDSAYSSLVGGFITAGAAPTVANVGANSCGTTAATIAGNDNAFAITVGATAGTQCRVAFTTTAANRWHCNFNNETTANLMRGTYVDTTHYDVSGTMVAGDVITGVCFAR